MPGLSSSKSQTVRRSRVAVYALMSTDEAATGVEAAPRTAMPYSVSIPHTLRIAMAAPYRRPPGKGRPSRNGVRPRRVGLEVLAGGGPLDGPAALHGVLELVDERADEHDPLALLARD